MFVARSQKNPVFSNLGIASSGTKRILKAGVHMGS